MTRNNPLTTTRDREWLKKYFSAATEFWTDALTLQEKRCKAAHEGPRDFATDLCFYVVAVQHLREIAAQAQSRLGISSKTTGLEAFDARWPTFHHLRNLLEHLLPVRADLERGDFGVAFFPGAVVDLKPGGNVEYLVEVEGTGASARLLADSLRAAIAAA